MSSESRKKKKGKLGKGLGAIFDTDISQLDRSESGFIPDVPISEIRSNPSQPRKSIEPGELIGLADSIREHGIIEPLIVTELNLGKSEESSEEKTKAKYQLIAGERRWRAAKLAKLETVPVVVREASPQQVLEIAIIENIQRKDLNPIEEATALKELYSNYRVKLDDIAKKVGKDVSTLSNKMRLLKLPKQIQQGLLNEEITESHAYQILTLKSKDAQIAAFKMTVKKGLSVTELQDYVKEIRLANRNVLPPKDNKNTFVLDEKTKEIQDNLKNVLGKGFRLTRKKDGGKITIPFINDDQLEEIHEFILNNKKFKEPAEN
jgi:ParB family chromosome partitioning protein